MQIKKYIISIFIFTTILNAKTLYIDFENFSSKDLASNWESTSLWKIQKESNNHILTMIDNKRGVFGFGSGFNICFNKNIKFKDGKISVKFRANSGKIDQGGGLMWRVLDEDNYYVARFNPLEDNFRFYKVIDGNRIELSSSHISLKKGWHTMSIVQKEDSFMGYLDGKKLLKFKDNSIKQSGAVGLWTKADAKTSFDNLTIKQ